MTTVTKRVSSGASASVTKRVSADLDELLTEFDPWDGAWGDSWGDSWRVFTSLSSIGATQRVSETPATDITKRVTL